jgi:glycosyltransferase involved in cell wall biosynthesis
MISVLINAYACSPDMGSEQGMSWNWIKNLSNYCKVHVITEGEYKNKIEEAVNNLPQRDNIIFYYNEVPDKVRKICWNQGDWRFYYYYNVWQKKTYHIALDIIKKNPIDIIHQLNMIGFREPGYLWKIKNISFIWGPIGGMENIPKAYIKGENIKQKLIVYLKSFINSYQSRYSPRVNKAINRADALIAAVKGVKDKIEQYHDKQITLINETGCYVHESLVVEDKSNKSSFDIIWVGKFDFRKQLGMALKTIGKIKNRVGLKFHIVGSGSKIDISFYKKMADDLGIYELCEWYGLIPNEKVQQLMRQSDLLFFTSIMEGTPHVVLEAIGNNLPVLCLNTCGQAASVNNTIGIKIEVTSLKQSIHDFANTLDYLQGHKEELYKMSEACKQRQKELSWDSKAKEMIEIYYSVLNKKKLKATFN